MSHRETYTVSVNYDDSRWAKIQRDSYTYVNSDLKQEHFPIGGHGVSDVVMEYFTFNHGLSPQEVMDEFSKRGLRCPDRAEAESFLDQYPQESKEFPVVGLCGSGMARRDARGVDYYVLANKGRRSLRFDRLFIYYWYRHCRFLAVRK